MRVDPAASCGPPKAPVALRVSAMRQGVTGMNCSALVVVAITPVPVIGTLCGDPLALSATWSVAVRVPTAPGVNTIEIAQLDPAVNVVPHAVVSAKSEALVPATEMVIPVSVPVPVFCRLIIWGELATPTVWLGKVIDGAENDTVGAMPIVSVTVVVLFTPPPAPVTVRV